MAEPKHDYFVQHPKNEDGEDVKDMALFTFSKPLAQTKEDGSYVANFLKDLPGIDHFELAGRYTVKLMFAKTFDADEVIEDIVKELPVIYGSIQLIKPIV